MVQKISRRTAKISPVAVEAFRAGDDDTLCKALRLAPWEGPSPLDIQDGEPCPYPEGTAGASWWPRCLELRRALLRADLALVVWAGLFAFGLRLLLGFS